MVRSSTMKYANGIHMCHLAERVCPVFGQSVRGYAILKRPRVNSSNAGVTLTRRGDSHECPLSGGDTLTFMNPSLYELPDGQVNFYTACLCPARYLKMIRTKRGWLPVSFFIASPEGQRSRICSRIRFRTSFSQMFLNAFTLRGTKRLKYRPKK